MDFSTLGASGAVVLVVYAFLRFMSEDRKIRESQHLETIKALKDVSANTITNTEVTREAMSQQKETTQYLKHRNGSFEKLIKEQPYIHQLVKEHFDEVPNGD